MGTRLRKYGIAIGVLLASLHIFSPSPADAKARRVTLLLKDSTTMTGELIAVHSTSLLVCREPWLSAKYLQAHPETVLVIPVSTLLRVHLEGHPNLMAGAGVGAIVGIAVGAKLANRGPERLSGDSDFNAFIGGLAGALPGFFVGMLLGGLVESGEQDIDITDPDQMKILREAARFQKDEPEVFQRKDAP
jgi:hypothetical protein